MKIEIDKIVFLKILVKELMVCYKIDFTDYEAYMWAQYFITRMEVRDDNNNIK